MTREEQSGYAKDVVSETVGANGRVLRRVGVSWAGGIGEHSSLLVLKAHLYLGGSIEVHVEGTEFVAWTIPVFPDALFVEDAIARESSKPSVRSEMVQAE